VEGFAPLAFEERPVDEMRARAAKFHDLMRRRRTVRHFSDREIPRDIIENALLTAGSAPSGAHRQPWHFVVVTDPAKKAAIREAAEHEERAFYGRRAPKEWLEALAPLGTDANKPFLTTAPVLIAVFLRRFSFVEQGGSRKRLKNYYTAESVGIATGLLIAGVFAAAMSSLSSSINSLASSSAYDFWAPLAGWEHDDPRLLQAGKAFSLGWSLLLVAGAVAFIPLSRGTSAVEVALGIAAVVYGGLLGAFALGVSTTLPGQRAAVLGIAAGVAAVASLQGSVSWLWYVPIGAVVTCGTGCVLGFTRTRL